VLDQWRDDALRMEADVGRVILGQRSVIRLVTVAVLARGHVLLQGDVGVGKTTLLRAFTRAIGGAYARVEGSVDLMPNDLLYYAYIGENGQPAIDRGPLLAHGPDLSILFFNEINRARPQVHALLLRAMAERSVHAFNADHHLPHLQVFADRNRLEREETFDISSAALDRFMLEIAIETPADDAVLTSLIGDTRFYDTDSLVESVQSGIFAHDKINDAAALIQAHTQTSPALLKYLLALWRATRDPAAEGVLLDGIDARQVILAGASPRGMGMLVRAARVAAWLDARDFVTPADVQQVFAPVIAHRLVLQPMFDMRRSEVSLRLCQAILKQVPAP
jgi:MoxR-like ATPase